MLNRTIFSTRLSILKKKNNIRSIDIANTLNIKKQSISTWENTKTIPTADKLVQLADYFDVSLDYLVGRSDDPKRY